MKSFLKSIIIPCLLTVTAVSLLSSCMPDASDPNSRLQVVVETTNIDSTLVLGNDSLTVNSVRMINGQSHFTINPDSTINLTGYIHQLSFSTESNDAVELIYPGPNSRFASGPIPEGVYQGITFKVIRAPEESDNNVGPIDNIFTDNGDYSIVVNGEFNGKEFTFKASKAFDFKFVFTPPLSVTAKSKLYSFVISTDLSNWFETGAGDAFLDPTNEANKPAIYSNIEESFEIEQLSPNQGNN